MILADKIIENRKKNGWSQEELADKLGVSRQSVSKWESAQAVPDMKKIIQMSEVLESARIIFSETRSKHRRHLKLRLWITDLKKA